MKILVVQQKMIGDVLAGTVICSAIKASFPKAEVHYLIYPNTRAVVDHHPHIDKILLFDAQFKSGLMGLITFGTILKKEKYDAVIDAYGKWESLIPTYFSGAKIRIGFKKWYTGLFYSMTVKPKPNVSGSAIYHRLQLAEAFTGNHSSIEFPKIYLTESEITDAKISMENLRLGNAAVVMISVMGSSDNKSLPAKQMAETIDIIAAQGNVILLFNFMPDQKEEARAIYNLCQQSTQDKIQFEFYSKGLRAFLAILSQCDGLIGNEGGAVNMAKALEIPTFTIFSPWINKSSWDMLNDDRRHMAVHLQDYFPEIYKGLHPKKLKRDALALYQKLSPNLFKSDLVKFVKSIIS